MDSSTSADDTTFSSRSSRALDISSALKTAIAAFAAFLALPANVASACAVCVFDGSDPSVNTYVLSTALLSFIPLLIMGGIFWYVVQRVRRFHAENESGKPKAVTVAETNATDSAL